jgi:hypothetical protein
MYQFDTSSTNASKARTTPTVSQLSYAVVASSTRPFVRATSQRSSGWSSPPGPAVKSPHAGRQASMLA